MKRRAAALAHARVAGGGALIGRLRRCGRRNRGQSDRRRGCGHASSIMRRHVRSGPLRRVSELNVSFNGKTSRGIH
jgi:hypothetical protein